MLEIAYQATLEGSVRALDLRDKEIEGHAKRGTALTRRLAQQFGVDEEALLHITRGALLQDIEKMAILTVFYLNQAVFHRKREC